MFSTFKIVVLSAVLSGLVVSTLWTPEAQTNVPTKTFVDRLPQDASDNIAQLITVTRSPATRTSEHKADRIIPGRLEGCGEAAWPYARQECVTLASGAEPRSSVRFVTVESRVGENTSVLVRMPQTTVASR